MSSRCFLKIAFRKSLLFFGSFPCTVPLAIYMGRLMQGKGPGNEFGIELATNGLPPFNRVRLGINQLFDRSKKPPKLPCQYRCILQICILLLKAAFRWCTRGFSFFFQFFFSRFSSRRCLLMGTPSQLFCFQLAIPKFIRELGRVS